MTLPVGPLPPSPPRLIESTRRQPTPPPPSPPGEGEDEGEGDGSDEEDNPFDNAPKGPKLSAKRLAAIGFVAKDDGKKKKAPAKKKAAPKKKK